MVSKIVKYTKYFAKGGSENVRENDMDRVDLDKVGHRLPPLLLIRNSAELAHYIHESNWMFIRGGKYPANPAPWSARQYWERRLNSDSQIGPASLHLSIYESPRDFIPCD